MYTYKIFKTEFDFIVDANEYYHEHCTLDDDYDTNYTIATFEEAKRLFEIEDYTIKIV
ncbi:hypothetical protein HDR58_09795 [bacterium]|nr:hypothetical protein [bacterium]